MAAIGSNGYTYAIYMAAIGSNGYTYAIKYQQEAEGMGLEATELAEHAPDEEGAHFPINMLFVDCQGNGAHVLVKAPMSEEQALH
jgi:hypothetical protein